MLFRYNKLISIKRLNENNIWKCSLSKNKSIQNKSVLQEKVSMMRFFLGKSETIMTKIFRQIRNYNDQNF